MPEDLTDIFPSLQNLNIKGIVFDDFNSTISCLATVPNLKSLYINLTEEEQVDFLMQTLPDLEFLNGIPVEREEQEEDEANNSFGTDEDMQEQNNSKYNPPNTIPEIEGDSGTDDDLGR